MCSKINMFLMLLCLLSSCTSYRTVQRISSGEMEIGLSVVEDKVKRFVEEDAAVMIDSMRNTLSDGPIIMNAIRDSETGEMIATDVINASKVTARFRNVAERGGYVAFGLAAEDISENEDSRGISNA